MISTSWEKTRQQRQDGAHHTGPVIPGIQQEERRREEQREKRFSRSRRPEDPTVTTGRGSSCWRMKVQIGWASVKHTLRKQRCAWDNKLQGEEHSEFRDILSEKRMLPRSDGVTLARARQRKTWESAKCRSLNKAVPVPREAFLSCCGIRTQSIWNPQLSNRTQDRKTTLR